MQVGRSFWPIPAYANVDAGYRVRLENKDVVRDPGDEGLSVEAALRYTLGGRNFPAGKQLILGLSTEVDVPGMGGPSPVR